MTIKYVLRPGSVDSKIDGDCHYITARQLASLYGVSMRDCVVAPSIDDPNRRGWCVPPDAIHLEPRYDGDYRLPLDASKRHNHNNQ